MSDIWLRYKEDVLNEILFAAIIPILIAIHFLLPNSIHDALVFDHSQFKMYTLWTSAYIHGSDTHLFQNITGYTMAIVPSWVIFSYHYRQRVPRRAFLVVLVLFPILISLFSYGVYQFGFEAGETTTRGFSGIVSAFFGLLLVGVLEVGYDRRGWLGVMGLAGANVLVVMTYMLILAGVATVRIVGLGTGGALLSLTLLISPEQVRERRLKPKFSDEGKIGGIQAIYGSLVLMYMLPQMFPLDWIRTDMVVDIFGHLSGLVLGALAGVVIIIWPRSVSAAR